MRDEAIQALMDNKIELAEEAQRREQQANRIYALILRLLNQSQTNPKISQEIGVHDIRNILNICVIANALERMADWAFKIAKDVSKIENVGVEISDKIKTLINDYNKNINDICEKAVKSVLTSDIELANMTVNHFEESLDKEAYNLVDKLRLENVHHGFGELRQIILALHRIGENAVTIATTTINTVTIEKDISSKTKIPILKLRARAFHTEIGIKSP